MTHATTSLAIVLLPRLSSSLGAQRSEASRSSDKEPNSPVIVSDAASDHDSSMEMPTSLDMDSTQTTTMSESSLLEASTSQPEERKYMNCVNYVCNTFVLTNFCPSSVCKMYTMGA